MTVLPWSGHKALFESLERKDLESAPRRTPVEIWDVQGICCWHINIGSNALTISVWTPCALLLDWACDKESVGDVCFERTYIPGKCPGTIFLPKDALHSPLFTKPTSSEPKPLLATLSMSILSQLATLASRWPNYLQIRVCRQTLRIAQEHSSRSSRNRTSGES